MVEIGRVLSESKGYPRKFTFFVETNSISQEGMQLVRFDEIGFFASVSWVPFFEDV